MTNYKVSNFSSKTPEAEQNKLRTNLKGISGVENVTLRPERGEFSLSYGHDEPKADVIKAAVKKAGFSMGARD